MCSCSAWATKCFPRLSSRNHLKFVFSGAKFALNPSRDEALGFGRKDLVLWGGGAVRVSDV